MLGIEKAGARMSKTSSSLFHICLLALILPLSATLARDPDADKYGREHSSGSSESHSGSNSEKGEKKDSSGMGLGPPNGNFKFDSSSGERSSSTSSSNRSGFHLEVSGIDHSASLREPPSLGLHSSEAFEKFKSDGVKFHDFLKGP